MITKEAILEALEKYGPLTQFQLYLAILQDNGAYSKEEIDAFRKGLEREDLEPNSDKLAEFSYLNYLLMTENKVCVTDGHRYAKQLNL